MKFLITRTSVWSEIKPCEEAQKEIYIDDDGDMWERMVSCYKQLRRIKGIS